MPDRLTLHAPILVNTIGHCAGAIAFGILLYLLFIDWRRATAERSPLPGIAAALALLWNVGSLVGMVAAPAGDRTADAIVAASFSVFSVLPAVLLHISLQSRGRWLWLSGYAVSAAAVMLHIGELITGAPRFHYAAILLVTIGFTALTVVPVVQEAFSGRRDGGGKRLAGAMVLCLFAISFAHFGSTHDVRAWSGEAVLHHAGIPLALFVLLQDYRFLLLDAFIRFLANGTLAALALLIAIDAEARFGVIGHAERNPFFAGILFTAACILLSLFAYLRMRVQRFLTASVFLRPRPELVLANLRALAATTASEAEYLMSAAAEVAEFFSARRFQVSNVNVTAAATAVPDPARLGVAQWVQAVAPLRFSRGDASAFLIGARRGGRRYLSEDLEMLERLGATVCEQVERMRSSEMQSLVANAELRALQAQINPHFFFNALNTLYGVISRDNSAARQLVLNLANVFRYSFAGSSTMSTLADEIRIVRAYLEIEALRLGPRLRTEFDVDESLLTERVPVLSIQPLVENAVKHGVARSQGGGFVLLSIQKQANSIAVAVSNSSVFLSGTQGEKGEKGNGIGLANVRQRLKLCYGATADLKVSTRAEATGSCITTVRFLMPTAQMQLANQTPR